MVAHFGQFVDHDISLTPENEVECCAGSTDSECFPIAIPLNDQGYDFKNEKKETHIYINKCQHFFIETQKA